MKNSFHIASIFALMFILTACGAESVQVEEQPLTIDSDANTAVPDLSVPAATPKTELPPKEATDYTGASGTQLAGTPTRTETEDGQLLIGGDAVAPAVTPGEVSYTIIGGNYYYDLDDITVKEGDEVTITFRAAEGFHDLVIDELNVATDQISEGQETTVTFTADKKGTFEFYCSVGSHRANGMVGTLTVK